jgi:hypothetical protein
VGGKLVVVDSFNILDLFGHEHSEDAQAEAMVEFGHQLGHDKSCEAAFDSYLDHANQAIHASCSSCGWRTVMAPEVVEQKAAPIRRRMAMSQSPLPARARRMQLEDHAPFN